MSTDVDIARFKQEEQARMGNLIKKLQTPEVCEFDRLVKKQNEVVGVLYPILGESTKNGPKK